VTALHDQIRRVLADGPAMRAVILFGSRARGSTHSESDIDLAILPADPGLALNEENLRGG
jgi:predicted nucleotidyltransferase